MHELSHEHIKKIPIRIRHDLRPGDIGAVIHLHGILYGKEYGFDHTFEVYVAEPLVEFVKSGAEGQRLWVVEREEKVMGSVAIVKCSETTAQLRWLILHPELRGCGVGKTLVEKAVNFCMNFGYSSVFLWTLSILDAATSIYRSSGFCFTERKTHEIWGNVLTEERYELKFKGTGIVI